MLSPVQLSLQELPSPEALDKARGEIQGKLAETGSRLAHLNWDLMRKAAGGALRDALGKLDVLEYVAGAWCTAVELQQLAKKTLRAPGTEEPFALYEQNPSALLHPVVKIKCGPVAFPALTFDLKLGAEVESAVLIIADGKLAAIESGTVKPFARLSYGEHELKKLDGEEVPITRRFAFPNGGIPIPCSADGEGQGEGDWTAL
jgi:hypothetical protein